MHFYSNYWATLVYILNFKPFDYVFFALLYANWWITRWGALYLFCYEKKVVINWIHIVIYIRYLFYIFKYVYIYFLTRYFWKYIYEPCMHLWISQHRRLKLNPRFVGVEVCPILNLFIKLLSSTWNKLLLNSLNRVSLRMPFCFRVRGCIQYSERYFVLDWTTLVM